MENKSTNELENILKRTSAADIGQYLTQNEQELLTQQKPFTAYMHQMLRLHGKTQQEVFLQADLPERFGYKLLSGEKHTKQRDYILRICYAAGMDLSDLQIENIDQIKNIEFSLRIVDADTLREIATTNTLTLNFK
jgi:hypothetical protein